MITDTDSGYNDGDYIRRVFFAEDDPYEVVVIRVTDQTSGGDDEVLITTEAYESVGDDPAYRNAFRQADVSFTPISIAGLGVRERLNGLQAQSDDYDGVPTAVRDAFKTDGFCLVPEQGEWPL
jgi:hypothetical protein